MVKVTKSYYGGNMNINPDKVKELILLFSELDEDYQKELLKQAYILSFKQSQKNLIKEEGNKFKSNREYEDEIEERSNKTIEEFLEIIALYDKVSDNEKAQLAILLNKLSKGKLTQKTDIEIKIKQKKLSIKDYIEEILPEVNFEVANAKALEYWREKDKF